MRRSRLRSKAIPSRGRIGWWWPGPGSLAGLGPVPRQVHVRTLLRAIVVVTCVQDLFERDCVVCAGRDRQFVFQVFDPVDEGIESASRKDDRQTNTHAVILVLCHSGHISRWVHQSEREGFRDGLMRRDEQR